MEGWIKVHRKILENPIVCKDSDYFSVWTYLLLNATHKEIPAVFKGKKILLQPGQLITGRISIAKKFNISESKVKRILNELESDQQIDRQRSNKNSLISIINWNEYQNIDQQIDQQMTNNRPTSDQQVTTNKNDKNIYLYLFNKYKEQICGKSFGQKIKAINECKNEEQYMQMSLELQEKLFCDLQSLK